VFDLLEWLTGAKPLVSAEEEDWQFACFEWLLRNTAGFGRFRQVLREIVPLPSVSRDIPAPLPTRSEIAKLVGTSP
jgi:hypothetical protein